MPSARLTLPGAPCVVLLHTLPDDSSHFDWLTARRDDPDAPLLSFRTSLRPDSPATRAFSATSLPDHRALYLEHEGPLEPREGRDRGAVVRLARGNALIERADQAAVVLRAQWGGAELLYSGRPSSARPGARWIFRVSPEH